MNVKQWDGNDNNNMNTVAVEVEGIVLLAGDVIGRDITEREKQDRFFKLTKSSSQNTNPPLSQGSDTRHGIEIEYPIHDFMQIGQHDSSGYHIDKSIANMII